jgi:hypothetical protein
MDASARESKHAAEAIRARVGAPVAPRLSIAVWRCDRCGIDRPRFD